MKTFRIIMVAALVLMMALIPMTGCRREEDTSSEYTSVYIPSVETTSIVTSEKISVTVTLDPAWTKNATPETLYSAVEDNNIDHQFTIKKFDDAAEGESLSDCVGRYMTDFQTTANFTDQVTTLEPTATTVGGYDAYKMGLDFTLFSTARHWNVIVTVIEGEIIFIREEYSIRSVAMYPEQVQGMIDSIVFNTAA